MTSLNTPSSAGKHFHEFEGQTWSGGDEAENTPKCQNHESRAMPKCCWFNVILLQPTTPCTDVVSYTHTRPPVLQTHHKGCLVQAVPLTFPPLLMISVLEYSTELSKASLHYWTPWILNETLKHSSRLYLPMVIQPVPPHSEGLQLSINHELTCIITV